MASNLQTLIGKLNVVCKGALEGAAGLCVSRTHYEVDLEHILLKVLEYDNTDLHRILRAFEINEARIIKELNEALDGFNKGNARTPTLSPNVQKLLERSWMAASVNFGAEKVRSGIMLAAMLRDDDLRRVVVGSSASLAKLKPEDLVESLGEIVAGSNEDEGPSADDVAEDGAPGTAPAASGGAAAKGELNKYTINLTERASKGEIDPVRGRNAEIRQMIDILTRRRQNNPILTGEAGVGKTAVVEGLALRIDSGDVPDVLKGVTLLNLDLGLLQAGASVKGEFERRLRAVIDEVKASPSPIVLFIDEAHQLIGAGGQAGQGDAANLLKPALARGELRTIAATTWSEYKKYFEKDAALTRRFQVVKVDEPDEDRATIMLRALAGAMERHHKVRILDEAVVDAVKLSHRYLTGRQLPDKAVSLLDTACARVKLSQAATPAPVEDAQRRIDNLVIEIRVLEREVATGHDHAEKLAALNGLKTDTEESLATLTEQWDAEKDLVTKIQEARRSLERASGYLEEDPSEAPAEQQPDEPPEPSAEAETSGSDAQGDSPADEQVTLEVLQQLNGELSAIQGKQPLMFPAVAGQTVAEVLSGWTGIPLGKMVTDEIDAVLRLQDNLGERVVGQDHALRIIAQRIQTARASLDDPGKPIGVFLLIGTSGVGKTETALALADQLYGGEHNVISINMSEYQEAHTVSSLKGSPPGYVGYGEGGVLTEAVRRKPYSVVLLDEVEKAHPDVLELFFQVFDKGRMEDGEGREIDFKNTVIILTSNVGTDIIMDLCQKGKGERPEPQDIVENVRPDLNGHFKPAFIGRTVVVPFYPINDEMFDLITRLKLNKIGRRIRENHRAEFTYDDSVVQAVVARCTEVDSGARNVDNILTGTVLPELSQSVLAMMATGERPSVVAVGTDDQGNITYSVR